jgi:hypothetical protein
MAASAATDRIPALELWQRQAVLAAASLLRARFNDEPGDARARTLHDALLEVIEPHRRTERLQREMDALADGPTIVLRAERRARGRRGGTDRRVWEFGPPRGRDRRRRERRVADERRTRR